MKRLTFLGTAVLVVMLVFGMVNPALARDYKHNRRHSPSIMPFFPPGPPIMQMPFGISFGNRNFRMSIDSGSGGFGDRYSYDGYGYNGYENNGSGYGGYDYDPYYGQRVQYPGQPYMPPSITVEEPSQPCFPDSPSVFINQGTRYVKRWTPGVGYYYVQLRRVQ